MTIPRLAAVWFIASLLLVPIQSPADSLYPIPGTFDPGEWFGQYAPTDSNGAFTKGGGHQELFFERYRQRKPGWACEVFLAHELLVVVNAPYHGAVSTRRPGGSRVTCGFDAVHGRLYLRDGEPHQSYYIVLGFYCGIPPDRKNITILFNATPSPNPPENHQAPPTQLPPNQFLILFRR